MCDIILKVPKGNDCTTCMFLDEDYLHNTAYCNLFKENLSCKIEYGSISDIKKIYFCPTDEN